MDNTDSIMPGNQDAFFGVAGLISTKVGPRCATAVAAAACFPTPQTDCERAGKFIEKVEQKRHRRFGATGWERRGLMSVTEIGEPENLDRGRQTEKHPV